jgi:hypothetical protein
MKMFQVNVVDPTFGILYVASVIYGVSSFFKELVNFELISGKIGLYFMDTNEN